MIEDGRAAPTAGQLLRYRWRRMGLLKLVAMARSGCHSGGIQIVSGRSYGSAMTTAEDRLMALEQRVRDLQSDAGPGQATALADGLKELRRDLAVFRRDMSKFQREVRADMTTLKADVTGLKADVTGLKADVGDLKASMAEVLRRLPPPPTAA
jgi:hypothetical protein